MRRSTSTRHPSRQGLRTAPAQTTTISVPRRPTKAGWGDLHLDHRIPTFLEAVFFEEEAGSSRRTRRLDA
jgi:hypothetical protein